MLEEEAFLANIGKEHKRAQSLSPWTKNKVMIYHSNNRRVKEQIITLVFYKNLPIKSGLLPPSLARRINIIWPWFLFFWVLNQTQLCMLREDLNVQKQVFLEWLALPGTSTRSCRVSCLDLSPWNQSLICLIPLFLLTHTFFFPFENYFPVSPPLPFLLFPFPIYVIFPFPLMSCIQHLIFLIEWSLFM